MRLLFVAFAAALSALAQTPWKAGAAKVVTTPGEPIRMAGFAFRNKPSEGVRQDIYARALVLQPEGGKLAAILTLDLASLGRDLAEEIAARCRKQFGIERDRLLINISHTHSGPITGWKPMPLYGLSESPSDPVQRYTAGLIEKAVGAAGAAIQRMEPATLSFQQGLAGIAVNRRRVANRSWPGPVDHDVPTLAVRDVAGNLRALVVGYACHATALMDYLISNDWPGYALEAMETAHPGITAIFVQGCGADSNPLPRAGEELARKRGEILAAAAGQVLAEKKMKPVSGPLRTALERVDLPFDHLPTRAELEKRLEDKAPAIRNSARSMLAVLDRDGKFAASYPLPVQVWQFGDGMKIIALGGEVVVDYSLRLKRQHGFETTWVAGYSNDLPAYIPSRRVLEEGGYEGGDAMIYFGRPGKFAPQVEELIVDKVNTLVQRLKAPANAPR